MECICNHLTTFVAQYFVPPNKVDITDVNIYKSIDHNFVIVIVVAAFWGLYLSLVIWAWREDNKDISKVGVCKMSTVHAIPPLVIIICNVHYLKLSTAQQM